MSTRAYSRPPSWPARPPSGDRGRPSRGGARSTSAGAAALRGPRKAVEEMCAIYQRRRDLGVGALCDIGVDVEPPKGTIYIWAPVPAGHTSTSFTEKVLEEAAGVISP